MPPSEGFARKVPQHTQWILTSLCPKIAERCCWQPCTNIAERCCDHTNSKFSLNILKTCNHLEWGNMWTCDHTKFDWLFMEKWFLFKVVS
jgi:hypothetical protein